MTISRTRAKQLTQRVLKASTFEDVQVVVSAHRDGNTRFALNRPTTTGDVEDLTITVTATLDGRSASVTGNRADDASIQALVKEAEELARVAPKDPESMPPLGPQRYPTVNATDPKVRKFAAVDRAPLVEKAVAVARSKQLIAAGLMRHRDQGMAIANKNGLFGHYSETEVDFTTTCRTEDGSGSGRAGYTGHLVSGLDAEGLARRAADKALQSRQAKAIDPGRYTVILEPQAVADLLSFLMNSLQKRAADEGRSYFAKPGGGNRVGERMFDERIRLWSDPADPDHPSSPLGPEGLARQKTVWVEGGVLKNLINSRYWAKTHGGEPIPTPGSLFLGGGQGSVDDLIKNTARGVLVTRFWYNRMLEPRTILVTGMTRDGTYLVENGAVKHAVKNMRYNESPLTLLKNVIAMGVPQRAGMGSFGLFVVPPMVVDGFHFASASDAV